MVSFLKGFVYAFNGIVRTVIEEKNMRFHLVLSVYMYSFLLLFDFFTLSKGDWIAIVAATTLVLSAELFNTAVEKSVDLSTTQPHDLAKFAKDASAGAVFICAAGAVAVGFIVLWQPEAFRKMFEYYKGHILMFVLLVVSIVFSAFVVLKTPKKKI